MEFIADGLLIATGMTAGLYCLILSRRLRKLTDSGSGIGAQIELLDRALSDTRTALSETREGVGNLRASVKSSQTQLARDVALAAELAARLETTIAKAEAATQRLYQTESRLELYQERLDRNAGDVTANAVGEPGESETPGEKSGGPERGLKASVMRVELPDGAERLMHASGREAGTDDAGASEESDASQAVRDFPQSVTGPASSAASRSRDGGRILKAERMML